MTAPALETRAARRFTTAQAAKRLRIHPKTLRRLVNQKKIVGYRLESRSPSGRRYEFDEEQLRAYELARWRRTDEAAP